ncbi:MAG: C40 family peptidase [Armatimonadetes bacterium]|nr:C40 family peptidase [Armatimonadota bacterium]
MTRKRNRFLGLVALLGLTAGAIAQQPLPNLVVDLDGETVELKPVMLELNTYLVPLRETVRVLTKGEGKLRVLPGTSFDILIHDQVRVRIPISTKVGKQVEVFGKEGPPRSTKLLDIESYPYEITPKGGVPTSFIDAELLCSALGVSFDINGAKMSMLTPEYWCRQVGISANRVGDRVLQNLENLPEFGISPPARTILGWVRPAKTSYAQAYRLSDGKIDPIVGVNALGDPIEVITPGDTPKARQATGQQPLRFETYNYGSSVGKTVSFVAVVTTKNLGDRDPVKAINAGELKDDEWSIVGIRQRVNDMPVVFENRPVNPGEDVASFSERNRNSPSIVRVLNGLRQGANVAPGTKLCVMVGMSEEMIAQNQKSRYEFKGLYEVQVGDTTKALADAWSVSPDDIYATNVVVPPGGDPMPGDLLNIIASKDGKQTTAPDVKPADQENTSLSGTAVTLDEVDVHETSRPDSPILGRIPKNRFIEVLGKVEATDSYRVRFDALMGFVPGSGLRLRDVTIADGPDANDDIVAREALKYVGTPYLWGGNSLTQGIDCSHYVAQIFSRIGWKSPSPPVVIQETIGDLVHCKPGTARRSGQTIVLPNPVKYKLGTTDIKKLRPGDRIIFQRGNTDASGSRHTGIYLGRVPAKWRQKFGEIPFAFAHASSSRGVTVGSLTSRYYWNIYRFSVRSGK